MAERAPVRIAVMGAGAIGRRHVECVRAGPDAQLHSIVDPSPAARQLAESLGAPWFPDFKAMLGTGKPGGIIIATPNQMHAANGLDAVAARIPALIEKPLADDAAEAARLVEAGEAAGVPLLTGHHRRHNPVIQRAKAIVESGALGRLVSAHAFFWLMKPDDYFDIAWRRELGAGPLLMNLTHDIDLLRHLCGEVEDVQAFQSNSIRKNAVDETTVATLRFANGALGTVNISDTIVAPWSWEHTSGENPAYPRADQISIHLGGTKASLAVPSLELWRHENKPDWFEPFSVTRGIARVEDPLKRQVAQFVRVIRDGEAPLVSAREGLLTLKTALAIQAAARTGQRVSL